MSSLLLFTMLLSLWFVGRLPVRSLLQNLHDRDLVESKLFTKDAHKVSCDIPRANLTFPRPTDPDVSMYFSVTFSYTHSL